MATTLKTPAGEEIALHVFMLRIQQREGLKALCDIEITDVDDSALPDKIDVWMDGICQFRGQVTGILKHFTPQTSKIELTQICAPSQALPAESIQFGSPHEHLPVLPYYDRITGEISETDLLQGKQELTIDEKSIIDYASSQQPRPTGIDLHLETKWRFQYISCFDIWAEIKAQNGGEFATLTPDAFIQKWHAALQLSPQSGYQVIYNQLHVQKPCFSEALWSKKRIKGGVIDGQCLMRATQEQKYHEIIQYSLGKNHELRKRLHLKVPMTEYEDTTFFTTPMGKQWFEPAHAIAHNYFLACNRQTRITVEAALEPNIIAKLTTDTQITVAQKFSGKIMDYVITETESGCTCRITLCETLPLAIEPPPALPINEKMASPQKSFVYDMDLQNLFSTQNDHALAHKVGALKLPVTTVHLQLRDLTSKPTEPKIYRI